MTLLFDHPYTAFLERVAKPIRYTGGEHGIRVKDWSKVEARVCLAFPDVHEIASSHLGLRILYQILNDHPRTLAERCFAPWKDLEAELLRHDCPLVSLESARPLGDFDIVGFSLQYELGYTNVLAMLDLGRIPRRAADRREADPLVVVGGPVACHIEPFAPFVDAALLGEGEEGLVELALAWVERKLQGGTREDWLGDMSQIRGVYVPSLYTTALDPTTYRRVVNGRRDERVPLPVERRWLEELDRFAFPAQGPVGGPEAVFDRLSVELGRGCTEGCRFCQAGMIYRPARERDPASVLATIREGLKTTGWDEVSLTALSTADISYIAPLIRKLGREMARERVSLSVASLRAYGLSDQLLSEMCRVRAGALTFAPEAGTQRLRDVINKNVTERDLFATAERVFRARADKLKLYFMLGLPTETEEDVRAIAATGRAVLAIGKQLSPRARVTVSVSSYVPKPHTPFQWCAMDTREKLREKQALLRQELRGVRGLELRLHDVETSLLEGILARGDRRLADVIEDAYLQGARFDAWEGELRPLVWQAAFRRADLDPEDYLRALPLSGQLPWDHLAMGPERRFLAREYARALAERPSAPCTKEYGQRVHESELGTHPTEEPPLVCHACGIECDLEALRRRRVLAVELLEAQTQDGQAALPEPPDWTPEARRPPRGGGDPVRWRLAYEKTGRAALLGHLDLVRELPRIIRRAGVRMAYTAGFHPKPQLSLPPALSVGVSSLGECLDVKLLDAPPPDELLAAFGQAASGGLRFFAARPLEPNEAGLSSTIDGAEYVIGLGLDEVTARGGPEALEELVGRFLKADSWQVERRTKKGGCRTINLREFVEELGLGGDTALAELQRAGATEPLFGLSLRVKILGTGGVRPSDVVHAVLGEPHVPHAAVRSRLLHGEMPAWEVFAPPRGSGI